MTEASRAALEGLVGRAHALDVRLPASRPLPMPNDPAEAEALAAVVCAMRELQRAVEAYHVATGCWSGRPTIAVGFSPNRTAGGTGR